MCLDGDDYEEICQNGLLFWLSTIIDVSVHMSKDVFLKERLAIIFATDAQKVRKGFNFT